MYEIVIDGVVGWDIVPNDIVAELKKVPVGEKLRITLNSPGGSVYDGIAIFNAIRDFARKGNNEIETYIQGIAASMGSVIALAANNVNKNNKVIVEDNSVYMIHNAWGFSIGDKREMESNAKLLASIDAMLQKTYTNRTGKDAQEISAMCDDETWLFGQEIIDNGFADEIVESNEVETSDAFASVKNEKIIHAKLSFDNMQKKVKAEQKDVDAEKIAACLKDSVFGKAENANTEQTPVVGEKNNTEDSFMTKDELKQKHPELYAQIYGEGVSAGVTEERERCENHLKMAGTAGDVSAALPFIKDGKSCSDNAVASAYFEVMAKGKMKAAQVGENIGAVNAADGDDNGDGSDDNGFMAAFNKAGGYKDVKGA